MTRRWALHVAACLLAGAAVLTGCSEKQAASGSLPTTSSAEPTEDALPPLGPEDLPMPDEARTQDAAGAEAFVRYYIELINRTSTVMDAQPLRDFSDGCRDCDRIAGSIEQDAAAGKTYSGGEITVLGVGEPLMKTGTASMALQVDQAALNVLDASGAIDQEDSSGAYLGLSGGAAVRWNESTDSWLMTALTLE
ncbi:hypothetical protein DQ239_03050 [Blastococcus sp. TF02-09]|uniref:DUF6318 family protein n=1 Tax=Blastococcus sp. TF02-09 TaxID=2250576 RepID=UPI000E13BA58|nr:DUF6318 family protein [Blastococcus sp. TF02-9]RBY80085.1 hypothetical protein DQ239_03050 [Blastococcus sp. TF02-9]